MDDFGGFVLGVVLITLIAILAVVGIAVIAIVAVTGALGFLAFLLVKAILTSLEEIQAQQERQRVEAEAQRLILARQAAENAERERILREAKEEAEQKLRLEEERRQQEQARQAQEEAARQRLEAERDEVEHAFVSSNGGLRTRKPSAEQINAIIDESSRILSHCGKYLHIIAVVGPTGVALEWKAHTAAGCVPQVVGLRGSDEMFCEWAFTGRHTALLPPGRHTLSFRVNRSSHATGGEMDLAFEIFVPTASPASAGTFKQAVDATANAFIERTTTVAEAKRRVEEALAAQHTDPDEIDVEMAKLDVQIKDLHQTGG